MLKNLLHHLYSIKNKFYVSLTNFAQTFVFITAKSHSNLISVNSSKNNPENLIAEIEISKLFSAILKTNLNFKSDQSEKKIEFTNKVFSVGGFVRDQHLNFFSNDLDLVIELNNGAELFSNYIHNQFQTETTKPFQKGLGYPIWSFKFTDDINYQNVVYKTKNGSVDFADSQKECFPDPTTRQRITTYGNLTEDIQRRDFTINMLAENLTTNEIIDLSESAIKDLHANLIQTHPKSNPDQVFADDPLRMIRAVRFSCKYNFQIAPLVKDSIQKNASRIEILSKERIWDEFKKIITNKNIFQALQMLKTLDLLKYIFTNPDRLNISNSEFEIAADNLALNLAVLFKNFSCNEAEQILKELKTETGTRKHALLILSAVKDSPSNITSVRQFARTYSDQLQDVQILIPALTPILTAALKIPLQMIPKLNGHDVMNLFNAQGAQIQKILSEALKIEDELILKTKKKYDDPELQTAVLNRLKALFIK